MGYKYYVNNSSQQNGDHEVHKEGCSWLSMAKDVKYLGVYNNGNEAVAYAKRFYYQADGCYYCCREAHTS